MGNGNSTNKIHNLGKRNIRIVIAKEKKEIDAFLTSQAGDDAGDDLSTHHLPGSKTFTFKMDVAYTRILASQSHEFPWEEDQFVSIFVEDEDDENICCKDIAKNMAIAAPFIVVLYEV